MMPSEVQFTAAENGLKFPVQSAPASLSMTSVPPIVTPARDACAAVGAPVACDRPGPAIRVSTTVVASTADRTGLDTPRRYLVKPATVIGPFPRFLPVRNNTWNTADTSVPRHNNEG